MRGAVTMQPMRERCEGRGEKEREERGREPRGGNRRKKKPSLPGPVPSRSHVRPYNTRNTCNTDNTCNTCVTHYTPARMTDRLSRGSRGDDDRSRLPRPCATPRDFPKDHAGR